MAKSMDNVIVKIDSKVLDDLVRKECIEFADYCAKQAYGYAEDKDMELREGEWVMIEDKKEVKYTTTQLYNVFKSQSKEKVNEK